MTDTHEPEFFDLPSADDHAYWERFVAAGLHQPEPAHANGSDGTGTAWQRINLADPLYAIPAEPPAILGLLYNGKRHVISGPPESTKTLIAYRLLLEAMRNGQAVAIVDFEMGPTAARRLLEDCGATPDELAATHYYEPDTPPEDGWLHIVLAGVRLVVIDAAIGAYDTSGLDDNARKDVEQWAAAWIRPLYRAGVTTLTVDHVVKNAENRGKFTIGSERKLGGTDVHLSLESLKALHRGGTGMVKINVMKDRPGHLPRPTAYIVDLRSDPDTHQINFEFREPIVVEDSTGEYRHTIYMERVSKFMEQNAGHRYSKNELEQGVEGKAEYIRLALQELCADSFVMAIADGKWLRYTLVRPFVPGSSPVRPDEGDTGFVPSSPSLQGRGTRDETNPDDPTSSRDEPRIDVSDPAVQALLDDPEF